MTNENASAEFRQAFDAALGGSSTYQAARRLGWIPESAADHGGRADALPETEAPRVRATDPAQARGVGEAVYETPEHKAKREFAEMTYNVLGPIGTVRAKVDPSSGFNIH